MEPITKQDLKEFGEDLKEHISDKLKPMRKDIADHELLLCGKSKRNGLVGDVGEIKAGVGAVKWFAGIGGLGGIWAGVKSMWG